jgi:16S rRNA (guanine527-N7)-methyltransferase
MIDSSVQLAGSSVSRETYDRLRAFEGLVHRWTPVINLVSKSTLPTLWDRHIVDSAQLFWKTPAVSHWADLGSGGGFPGIVVAILAQEREIPMRMTLVESDLRKAAFLRQAAQGLDLPVVVLSKRIDQLPPLEADVLSARALAPLPELLGFASRHLREDGLAIFPKGSRHAEEVAAARKAWTFDVDSQQSLSEPGAAILMIRNIHRASND